MKDEPYQYTTGPTTDGNSRTTHQKRREPITQQQAYDYVHAELNGAPCTPEVCIPIFCKAVVDWTVRGHPVGPIGDDMMSFICSCGGSSPVGQPEPHTFDDMEIALTCHYATTGRARAKAQFQSEKVGEQNRIVPVFSKVYDSMSKLPNHYVAGQGLVCVFDNNNPFFDPTLEGHYFRFHKADGTSVLAASYAYFKGNTIVPILPTGLTGPLQLEASMSINGSVRSAIYPFPLA